jgi:hypothetical protein
MEISICPSDAVSHAVLAMACPHRVEATIRETTPERKKDMNRTARRLESEENDMSWKEQKGNAETL